MLCNECNKKKSCVKLCEEAEEFVDQDHSKLKETRLSDLGILIDKIIIDPITTIDVLNTKDWIELLKRVKTLTKKQKRNFYLHYWKGLSQREIARRYNTYSSNINMSIKTARGKIRKELIKM